MEGSISVVLGLVTLLYMKVVKDMTFNRGVIFVMF